jgi:hypothetical protein
MAQRHAHLHLVKPQSGNADAEGGARIARVPDVMTVPEYLASIGRTAPKRAPPTAADRQKEAVFGALWNAHYPPLPPYVRQWRFAKSLKREWAADYGWPALAFGLEVDGGIWKRGGGAHSHPSSILRDMEKHNGALLCGVRLYRVTTDQVASGLAVAMVRDAMIHLRLIASSATLEVPP